jgi:hypothetical protein
MTLTLLSLVPPPGPPQVLNEWATVLHLAVESSKLMAAAATTTTVDDDDDVDDDHETENNLDENKKTIGY